VKVLTYNIHGWLAPDGTVNVDRVTQVIAASEADLVGLNEVFYPDHAQGRPALEQLAERLGMHIAFGPTQPSDPTKHPPYGNALLSRWPILAYAAHHLAPVVSYGRRGLLEARVLPPGGPPLTVYVTHLDHRAEEIRVAQWAAAESWLLRERGRPHLLMGDFNALAPTDYADRDMRARLDAAQAERGWPPASFDLIARVLKAGYVDAFAAAGDGPSRGHTFPADIPDRRIDYIFLPEIMRASLRTCAPLACDGVRDASDHLPVLAELDAAVRG
jgi:endonuclease/exonuclease/phosphatase family metal-dependent hydrolase